MRKVKLAMMLEFDDKKFKIITRISFHIFQRIKI